MSANCGICAPITIPASDFGGHAQKSLRLSGSCWHLACLGPLDRTWRGGVHIPPRPADVNPAKNGVGNLMSDMLRLLAGCVFLALAALTTVAHVNFDEETSIMARLSDDEIAERLKSVPGWALRLTWPCFACVIRGS